MPISDHKIDEVRQASDIVEVVSDYVSLKKRGAGFTGLCPFHQEKTPSFHVTPSRGLFKCFGCGEGGDVFHFIQRIEALDFLESVRRLAERARIELDEQPADREAASERERLLAATRDAARVYFQSFLKAPEAQLARDYVAARGLSAASVKRFAVGYSAPGWADTLSVLGEKGHTLETLEGAGLILPSKRGGYYDRFRNRLMFPIVSHVGKVIGFGARQLVDEPGQPKYLNSPETAIYAKGSVLYGLYHAKQAIRQQEEALLVEGYMDVISCSQHGVDHVVAASGTALTLQQVQLLGRYARTVVLLFDADRAGQAAARKSIDIVLQGGLTPMIVTLPEGEDPDSLLRTHGSEAFREMLRDRRQDFITYFVAADQASLERDDPTVRAAVQNTCLNHIARIDDPLVREAYVRKLGSLLGATDTMLFEVLSGIIRKQSNVAPMGRDASPTPPAHVPAPSGPSRSPTDRSRADDYRMPSEVPGEGMWASPVEERAQPLASEKLLLRLVLLGGMSMAEFVLGRVSLDVFTAGNLRAAMQIVLAQYEQGLFSEASFVQEAREKGLFPLYAEVMVPQHEASKNWEHLFKIPLRNAEDHPEHLAATAILRLQQERLRSMLADAYAEVAHGERLGDTERIQEGQERIVQLQAIRRTLTLSFIMDGG